jgi:3-oxoacyl-[acyl-carrier protein] reductase
MDLGLAGRVALVTGSSRGIGLGAAHALASEGCRVMLTGRTAGALASARDGFPDESVATFTGDLTRAETLHAAAAQAVERWGVVDILVANIGSGTARAGWALAEEDWEASFELNVHASRRAAEAVLPHMTRAGRGSVVFIASIVGVESVNGPLPYSAAKTALVAYAKNLARTVASRGVRVNVVAPGNILFDGGTWARKLEEQPEPVRAYINAEVPLGRFGTPQEIGNVVAFLASDRASFVTGACFVADGGQTRGYR